MLELELLLNEMALIFSLPTQELVDQDPNPANAH
jgi:hypothetical protein